MDPGIDPLTDNDFFLATVITIWHQITLNNPILSPNCPKGPWIIPVNQYLRHNLDYKQKVQAIRRNQVYFSSFNVSTDATVIFKD